MYHLDEHFGPLSTTFQAVKSFEQIQDRQQPQPPSPQQQQTGSRFSPFHLKLHENAADDIFNNMVCG